MEPVSLVKISLPQQTHKYTDRSRVGDMAEAGQQRGVTAAFPPPPPFWKHFSPANIERLEKLKNEIERQKDDKRKKTWSPTPLRILELPPELRYLVPPEIPTTASYNLFGESQPVRLIPLSFDMKS